MEVEGAARDGVIIATKVSIENEDEDEHNGFELHGAITMLDTNSRTFMLRGVRINYAGATFKDGSQSNLAEGSQVEVKAILSTNGSGLVATTIDFEH